MKRLLLFLLLPACLLLYPACDHISLEDFTVDSGKDEDGDNGFEEGEPTEADYYSVAELLECPSDTLLYVKGYIVGYIVGSNRKGATFGLPEDKNTNMLIADTPDEQDAQRCAAVKLENNGTYATRDELNLYDHPQYLGKYIRLLGQAGKYFATRGITRIYGFSIFNNADDATTPPDGEDRPDEGASEDTPGIDQNPDLIEEGR